MKTNEGEIKVMKIHERSQKTVIVFGTSSNGLNIYTKIIFSYIVNFIKIYCFFKISQALCLQP